MKIPSLPKDEYDKHLQKEKTHFNKDLYRENLTLNSSLALDYVLNYFKNNIVKKQTGLSFFQNVVERVNKKGNFNIKTEVFGFSFARRFVDRNFGCNYDIKNPLDKSLIDLIIKLDEEYTITHNLKPESIFLIMNKNSNFIT